MLKFILHPKTACFVAGNSLVWFFVHLAEQRTGPAALDAVLMVLNLYYGTRNE